jgi:tetratricopeptide (TPR) repeat protein
MMASVAVAALALAGLAVGTILLWRERGRTSLQQAQTRENLRLALEALDHFSRAAVEGDYNRDPERAEQVEALQLDAIQLYARLIRQNPGDKWTRLRAAQAYHRLANIRSGLSAALSDRIRPAEAEEAFGEASTLLAALSDEDPADPACREESGQVLSDWGWFHRSNQLVGSMVKAEPTLRKALAIQSRLAAEFAGVPRYRLALSQTYVRLSYLLGFATRPAEVEHVLQCALSLRRELPGDSPGSLEGVAEIHGRLGHFMLTRGRAAEGVRSLDQALTMLDGQVQRDRSDPSHRRAVAELYTRICCPNLCSPELTDTLAPYFLKAVKAWEALVDDFPGIPDFQVGLSTAWVQDSSLMREAGRIPDATSALRRSVDVMERLCAQHPTVRRYRRHLAGLHLSMASLLDESDHPEAALPELKRSLELGSDNSVMVSQIAQWLAVCPDPGGRGPTKAAELALRFLAEKPESGALWQTLGLSRAEAGDWRAAVAALERAVSLQGSDVAARLALAVAYWHSGNEPMARKYYDASIVTMTAYERSSHRPRAQGGYLRRLQDQAAALLDPSKAQGGRP